MIDYIYNHRKGSKMSEIIELKPQKEKPNPEPKNKTEVLATLDNYINRIDQSCYDAISIIPDELKQELWDEEQLGIYKYVVDQLAAAEILINFKRRLEK